MIRRVLAVIVALSLFVCTAVIGFSAGSRTTLSYGYTFPRFSGWIVSGPVSDSWVPVASGSAVVSSVAPYSSFSYSSFSFSHSLKYINFDLSFLYDDYSFKDSSGITHTYQFSSISPVSVPVVVRFRSTAPSSVLLNPIVHFMTSYYDAAERVDLPLVDVSVLPVYDLSHYTYSFSIPYSFLSTVSTSRICGIQFYFEGISSMEISDFSLSFPSALPVVDSFGSTNLDLYDDLMRDNYFSNPTAAINAYYGFKAVIEGVQNSVSQQTVRLSNAFSPFLVQSTSYLSSLNSFFLSQADKEENVYSDSVPDDLKQQQQEAQNQLTDYEQKEQAVFDNLNTSLDNLNLNQYSNFSPSIVSSMAFINGYVTKGFDGLGDFKIILFLPMVIGIGLSVIGRMGHMLSNRPTKGRGDGP